MPIYYVLKQRSLKPLTISRLELCEDLLLAKLINKVEHLQNIEASIHFWSDSQIILCRILSSPASFQTFISHLVAEIQNLSGARKSNYVKTSDNRVDWASRGEVS